MQVDRTRNYGVAEIAAGLNVSRAVRRYWEQVIREELLPVRQVPRAVPLAEDGRRERRAARRAVARIAAGGRAAHVVVLVALNVMAELDAISVGGTR